ncbi:MAG: hypothetical protein MJ200_02695 [Mycoplasmoidaceae bacterium]|nr:hypothetical protein [Mycoplasmoidaceae bacterium]
MPTDDGEGNEIKRLYSHAFDATLFEDHDIGLPNFIETIEIPCNTYLSIGEKAIAYANDDNELTKLNFSILPSKPMTISANAFYNLNNVSEIHFDVFDPDDCDILNGK